MFHLKFVKYIFVIKSFTSFTVPEKIRSTETLGPSSGCTPTRTSTFFNITWVQLHFGLMMLLIHELSGGGGMHFTHTQFEKQISECVKLETMSKHYLNRHTCALTDSFHKCLPPPPRQNVIFERVPQVFTLTDILMLAYN